jgi:hypothetical protein
VCTLLGRAKTGYVHVYALAGRDKILVFFLCFQSGVETRRLHEGTLCGSGKKATNVWLHILGKIYDRLNLCKSWGDRTCVYICAHSKDRLHLFIPWGTDKVWHRCAYSGVETQQVTYMQALYRVEKRWPYINVHTCEWSRLHVCTLLGREKTGVICTVHMCVHILWKRTGRRTTCGHFLG